MQHFIAGDIASFEILFGRYKAPVFAFIHRQCPRASLAEELTQEVFMRVIRGASSFRAASKFSTWIYRIARNQVIDNMRRQRYRKATSIDHPARNDGPALGEKIPDTSPGPDRQAVTNRLRDDLERAIANLPDNQKEVFLLREYGGLKFDEISEIVGAKVGTVKSRMRYALESLQQSLSGYKDYARSLS